MCDRVVDCASGGNQAMLVCIISPTPESHFQWIGLTTLKLFLSLKYIFLEFKFDFGRNSTSRCSLRPVYLWGKLANLLSLSWLACAEEREKISSNLPGVLILLSVCAHTWGGLGNRWRKGTLNSASNASVEHT